VHSREISIGEGLVLVPLVLLILAIALYPQFALQRSERTVTSITSPPPSGVAKAGWTPYAPLQREDKLGVATPEIQSTGAP
jgi:hypothetical protein